MAATVAFVTPKQVHLGLRNQGVSVSLATAYRILAELVDEGAVDQLHDEQGQVTYRRCSLHGHHHHLVCRKCGTVAELEAPFLNTWASAAATDHGFAALTVMVKIYGLCTMCSGLS